MLEQNESLARSASPALAVAMTRARSAWPAVAIGDEAFASYVAARLPESSERRSLATLAARIEELYIACACALGEPAAIGAFERVYFDEVDRVATRLAESGVRSEDLRQHVRERLFVGTPETPPRISTFSGEGELRGWLRAVAMRGGLNMARVCSRDKERINSDESLLSDLPDVTDDPELGFMKRHYRAEFGAAVSDAFSSLTPRDRTILKYATAEQLSSAAIGSIYGVHRTTAKRWLEEAQDALLAAIRKAMMDRLGVNRRELESILRLVKSRLELRLD